VAKKSTLDKDLKKIASLESAARDPSRVRALGLGFLFLLALLPFIWLVVGESPGLFSIMVAGVIGGYMALNIGANDVANNMGPAVGAKALTLIGALVIAAVCEAAGALLAGSDVVGTISKGIIDPSAMADTTMFIRAMMAALLAAALWINLATWLGAPVSTTHAVVGGVVGVGMVAGGVSAVNWPVMGSIAASWVISPALGGIIAALVLALIKKMVLAKEDKITAAKAWVPLLVAVMGAAFTAYLMAKGLKNVYKTGAVSWVIAAAVIGFATWAATRAAVNRAATRLENSRKGVASLFTVPLIVSAALLSFAHGANDVANAVGPLAGIVTAVETQGSGLAMEAAVRVPGWVLIVGAVGISVGLVLFGPKLIHAVGEKITKLDPVRAFCVALSAAVTVIAASALGLPVSSTHIAVGGVFGVGFLREWYVNNQPRKGATSSTDEPPAPAPKDTHAKGPVTVKQAEKNRKRRLVRRQYMSTIVAAWVITVPLSAGLAAVLFAGLEALWP
jgi:PiT family inorganic phosphate transporter